LQSLCLHGRGHAGDKAADRCQILDLIVIVNLSVKDFVDVEEVFDAQIDYHDDLEELATVGRVVSCVAAAVEAKALQRRSRRSVPRKRGNWMSTRATSRPASSSRVLARSLPERRTLA